MYLTKFTTALVAAVAVLLAVACSSAIARPAQAGAAAAGPNTDPVRFWSLSRFDYGAGQQLVTSGAQQGDTLQKSIQVGPAAFDLQPPFPYKSLPSNKASASLFSSADGAQLSVLAQAPTSPRDQIGAPIGTLSVLDQYQAYVKRTRTASLRITLSDVLLRAIDANAQPDAQECPRVECIPIQTFASFFARAYAASADGDFFRVAGTTYFEGYKHHWEHDPGTLTGSTSTHPLWDPGDFTFDADADHSGTGASAVRRLRGPITVNVPLTHVRRGELFAVHVSLLAKTIDLRGGESGAQAFIQDPQHLAPRIKTRGLERRGAPRFKEPPLTPPPAARCPAGPRRRAGTMQFSDRQFSVDEATGTPVVIVTRKGGSRGAASVTVRTRSGSATSGSDFKSTTTRVTFSDGDSSPRLVEIPIRGDRAIEQPEDFTVSLSHVRCAGLGKQRSASITILDDDKPPPPPPPTFTVGGTVDGLQGSGLVLATLAGDVPVSANGGFTIPGAHTSGELYDVKVRSQPRSPDQLCTVQNGTGHVDNANVTNIAVHCETQATPSGLDLTFGDAGRVTTPGQGEGRAVVLQSDSGIVTVGPREVGVNFHFDFGATRHDAAGHLDTTFGTGGLATTDLGGNDDKANDAALLADDGFVTVGGADPAGLANQDFGVVRYTADGRPNPAFDTDGIATTDITGRGDVANAVAVQPDGKIVAAGEAETGPGLFDFALVRYKADGTRDSTFGGDGIVITDFGTQFDDVHAVAVQPDGKIVAVGTAESTTDAHVALARYLPNGDPDPTFGTNGTMLNDIGTDVVNGIAITADGKILVAGTRGSPNGSNVIVASFASNGDLDRGFGQGGVAEADLTDQDDSGNNLVLDAHGNIVVVGASGSRCASPACGTTPPPPAGPDMALVRFKPDGTVDTSLSVDFHGRGDIGHDVAIDAQGRIVAAGTTSDGSSDGEFALMRASL